MQRLKNSRDRRKYDRWKIKQLKAQAPMSDLNLIPVFGILNKNGNNFLPNMLIKCRKKLKLSILKRTKAAELLSVK